MMQTNLFALISLVATKKHVCEILHRQWFWEEIAI